MFQNQFNRHICGKVDNHVHAPDALHANFRYRYIYENQLDMVFPVFRTYDNACLSDATMTELWLPPENHSSTR